MLWGYVITASAALAGAFGTQLIILRSSRTQRALDRADLERIAQRRAVADVLSIGQRYSHYLETARDFADPATAHTTFTDQLAHDTRDALREFEVTVAVAELTVTRPEVRRVLMELTVRGFLERPPDTGKPPTLEQNIYVLGQVLVRLDANLVELKQVASAAFAID